MCVCCEDEVLAMMRDTCGCTADSIANACCVPYRCRRTPVQNRVLQIQPAQNGQAVGGEGNEKFETVRESSTTS